MNTQTITASNESRLSQAQYSEALTAFSTGWNDPENLAELLDFIAPAVPVARRFEFKRADNSQCFLSETDDIRATGSAFKRVEYTGDTVYEKTLNKGLTIRVDHDEVYGDNWEERYVQLLMQRLYRNDIRRALAALSQSSASTDVTFATDGSASNPDAAIRKLLLDATNQSGIRPNRLLFGESAWELRTLSYEAQNIRESLSLKALKDKLMIDNALIAKARYQADPATKASFIANEIYAFFGQDGVTKDEPSNLKRFITPISGNPFAVYIEPQTKYTDITVEHYSSIIVTSNIGLTKLAVR